MSLIGLYGDKHYDLLLGSSKADVNAKKPEGPGAAKRRLQVVALGPRWRCGGGIDGPRSAVRETGAGAGAPWQWACEISVGRYVTARAPGGRLLLERKGDHRGSPRAVVERSRGM